MWHGEYIHNKQEIEKRNTMNRKKIIMIVVAVVLAVLIAGIGGYLYVVHEKTTKEEKITSAEMSKC